MTDFNRWKTCCSACIDTFSHAILHFSGKNFHTHLRLGSLAKDPQTTTPLSLRTPLRKISRISYGYFITSTRLALLFLTLLTSYSRKYSIYEATVAEWSSILKLAHQWDFDEVKSFALRELEEQEIPALQKIILYHTHDIDRNLLQEAYTALTVRDDPITIEEGYQLGLETALRLAHAREIARAPVFNKKSGTPRPSINLAGSELDALINRLFNLNLSLPDTTNERPPTPQTPTGRGTPTGGGRHTPQIGIQTNGTGSPVSTPVRGGSVMNACPFFSSHANLPVQVVQTGSTATATAAGASMAARAIKGAGKVEGVPNVPESKGKEAAAAEASLDSVMHLDVSKRDSMKRLFRMDISLSMLQRNREQRRRRPRRRKAPRRPRRVKKARGPRGNASQRSRAPAQLRARSVHVLKANR
jgi:hypothetical protein